MATSSKKPIKRILLGIFLAISLIPIYIYYKQRSLPDQSIDKNQRESQNNDLISKPTTQKTGHFQIPPIPPDVAADTAPCPVTDPKISTENQISPISTDVAADTAPSPFNDPKVSTENQIPHIPSDVAADTAPSPFNDPKVSTENQIPSIPPILATDTSSRPFAGPKVTSENQIPPFPLGAVSVKKSFTYPEVSPENSAFESPIHHELKNKLSTPSEPPPAEPLHSEPPFPSNESLLPKQIVATKPLDDAESITVTSEINLPNLGISESVSDIQFLDYPDLLEKFSQNISNLTEMAKTLDPKSDSNFFHSLKELFKKILESPSFKENEITLPDHLADLHRQLLDVNEKFKDVNESFENFIGTEICKLFKADAYETRFGAFELLKNHFASFFSEMFPDDIDPADYFLEQFVQGVGYGDKQHEIKSFWVILDHDPPKLRNYKNIFLKHRDNIYGFLTCGLLQNLNPLDEDTVRILSAHDRYIQIEDLLDPSRPGLLEIEKLITLKGEYSSLKKECVNDLSSVVSLFPFLSILSCEKPNFVEELQVHLISPVKRLLSLISSYHFGFELAERIPQVFSHLRIKILTDFDTIIRSELDDIKDKKSLVCRFRKHALNISLLHTTYLTTFYHLTDSFDKESFSRFILLESRSLKEFEKYFYKWFTPLVEEKDLEEKGLFFETHLHGYFEEKHKAYKASVEALKNLPFYDGIKTLKFLKKVLVRFDSYRAHITLLKLKFPDVDYMFYADNFSFLSYPSEKSEKPPAIRYLFNHTPYNMEFVQLLDQRYKFEPLYIKSRRQLQLQAYSFGSDLSYIFPDIKKVSSTTVYNITDSLDRIRNTLSEEEQAKVLDWLIDYANAAYMGFSYLEPFKNFITFYLQSHKLLKKLKPLLEPDLYKSFCTQLNNSSYKLNDMLDILDQIIALKPKTIGESVLNTLISFLQTYDQFYFFYDWVTDKHEFFSFSVEYLKFKIRQEELELEIEKRIKNKFGENLIESDISRDKITPAELIRKIKEFDTFIVISRFTYQIPEMIAIIENYFGVKKMINLMFYDWENRDHSYFELLIKHRNQVPQYTYDESSKILELARAFGVDSIVYQEFLKDKSIPEIFDLCLPLLIQKFKDDFALFSFVQFLSLTVPSGVYSLEGDPNELNKKIYDILPLLRIYLILLYSRRPVQPNPNQPPDWEFTKEPDGTFSLHAQASDLFASNEEAYFLWHGYLKEKLDSSTIDETVWSNCLRVIITKLFTKIESLVLYDSVARGPIIAKLHDPSNPHLLVKSHAMNLIL
jgi:hypothetical protein